MLGFFALPILPTPPKLVSIVWDGAADWVVDQLVEEGKLPNVAKLKRTGAYAESVNPAWPSKTAVGHAAIFTGVWANENGIANNAVPLRPFSEHTLLESRSGFDATNLTAEPLWVAAANQGRNVVALSAACSYPPSAFAPKLKRGARFREFSGFETEIFPRAMIRNAEKKPQLELKLGDRTFQIKLLDLDRKLGYDHVEISSAGVKPTRLTPRGGTEELDGLWAGGYDVQKGDDFGKVFFRLWSLEADGQMELYQRRVSAVKGTESAAESRKYVEAYGGFHDDAWNPYESGLLGKPLWNGGDGEAEKRMLELVKQDCDFLAQSFRYAWRTWSPDVTFHYTPMSDSAGHTLMGGILQGGKRLETEQARKLWEVYVRVYQLQDAWLGEMMRTVDRNTIVALMSDHGMEGCHTYLYVNRALEEAGLLAYTPDGQIDLAHTQIMAPPWSDFFLVVNTADHKGGIVPVSEKTKVLDRAVAALTQLRLPNSQLPVFDALIRAADHPGMGIGGPNGGDLYLEPAAGLYPSPRRSDTLTARMGPVGMGMHGFMPTRRTMQSIFYAAGGPVRHQNLGNIRQIDIMRWLAPQVGLRFANGN